MAAIFYYLATLQEKLSAEKEKGATVVEYALVIGGISIVLVLGAAALNTGLVTVWNEITTYLTNLIP
jgi:pilus assembly protein Flp/PilA